jgi:ribonuclease Z
MLVIDCPSPSHIPSLVASFSEGFYSKFHSAREEDTAQYSVRSVFHICGEGVLEDERYKEFMRGFRDDAHVCSNPRYFFFLFFFFHFF